MPMLLSEIPNYQELPVETKTKEHLGVLDFLRGFAAVSVMLYHFTGGPSTAHHHTGGILAKFFSPLLQSPFSWGNMGVQIFFVISGFVIPYSLWDSSYKVKDFFAYMLKRILRICPPAYVIILLILLQWLVVDYFIHHNLVRLSALTPEIIIRNFLFLYDSISPNWINPNWINGVFWTLALEFQFYVVIGLLFNVLFNNRLIVTIAVFAAMSAMWFLPWHANYPYYNSLFALGGITLLYYKRRIELVSFLASLAIFFLITYFIADFQQATFGLGTALVIAFVKMRSSFFSFFGKISFSLYLTHVLVGSTTEFLLAKVFRPTTELGQILGILIITAVACAAAYIYYLTVEQPALRLIKKLKSAKQ